MCGRFTLTVWDLKAVVAQLPKECSIDLSYPFRPNHNVSPSNRHPIIFETGTALMLKDARWGLVPRWSKDAGQYFINARTETAHEKPAFKEALFKRRCLVPVDGFYEWKEEEGKKKRPYWFHFPENQVFHLAGLFEDWIPVGGSGALRTFAVLTAEAAEWMEPYHSRMPLITMTGVGMEWLDPKSLDVKRLQALTEKMIHRAADLPIEAHEVSTYVNSPDNNGPRCIEPALQS
jgi:putative SOS response-associated peptidase YedK